MSVVLIDFNKVAKRGYMNPTQGSLACGTTSMGFKIMVKILMAFFSTACRELSYILSLDETVKDNGSSNDSRGEVSRRE